MVSQVILFLGLLTTAYAIGSLCEEPVEPSGDVKISGGSTARNDAVVSIRHLMLQGHYHVCGGFIIRNNWVMTAAQCVFDRDENNTAVGVTTSSLNPRLIYGIATGGIFVHQSFNVSNLSELYRVIH